MQPPVPLPTPPASPIPDAAARRTAGLVWFLGVVMVAVCGCCISGQATLATMDAAELDAASRRFDLPAQSLVDLQRMAVAMAVLTLALGLLPGLAYLVLGFGVRKRQPTAVSTCLLLAMTQAIVLGVLMLTQAWGAVTAGNPAALTLTALTHGTPTALLVYVIRLLLRLRDGVDDPHDLDRDPWNQPPT